MLIGESPEKGGCYALYIVHSKPSFRALKTDNPVLRFRPFFHCSVVTRIWGPAATGFEHYAEVQQAPRIPHPQSEPDNVLQSQSAFRSRIAGSAAFEAGIPAAFTPIHVAVKLSMLGRCSC